MRRHRGTRRTDASAGNDHESGRLASALILAAVLCLACGCGYQSVRSHSSAAHSDSWCVQTGPEPATHPQAVAGLELGTRDALARRERLASCAEARRLVIQVVDVQLEPVGVVTDGESVSARATRVLVSATGHVRSPDGHRDLGMVTEHQVVGIGSTPMSEEHARAAGVVTAARRAGEALVRRLLGEPLPVMDP